MNWPRVESERRETREKRKEPVGDISEPQPRRLVSGGPSATVTRTGSGSNRPKPYGKAFGAAFVRPYVPRRPAAKLTKTDGRRWSMSRCPHCQSVVRDDRLARHVRDVHHVVSTKSRATLAPGLEPRPPRQERAAVKELLGASSFLIKLTSAQATKVDFISRKRRILAVDLLQQVIRDWLEGQR